jgi:MoCo/4Fe-4S cofactor protein with predicted Tat translocation signal
MPEELKEQPKCLSLDELRDKLKTDGRGWRGLEEIAETQGFQELLNREFPRQTAPWSDGVNLRTFLKFMGASMALAGLAACHPQRILGKGVRDVAQHAGLEVRASTVRVDQLAIRVLRHGIDGEVAAQQVLLDGDIGTELNLEAVVSAA